MVCGQAFLSRFQFRDTPSVVHFARHAAILLSGVVAIAILDADLLAFAVLGAVAVLLSFASMCVYSTTVTYTAATVVVVACTHGVLSAMCTLHEYRAFLVPQLMLSVFMTYTPLYVATSFLAIAGTSVSLHWGPETAVVLVALANALAALGTTPQRNFTASDADADEVVPMKGVTTNAASSQRYRVRSSGSFSPRRQSDLPNASPDDLDLATPGATSIRMGTDYEPSLSSNASRNNLPSRYIVTLSDELRSPASGILGLIRLMLSDEAEKISATNWVMLESLALQLMTLINSVLDSVKARSEGIRLENTPFNFFKLFFSSLAPHRMQLAARDYVVVPYIDPRLTLTPTLCGDEIRIGQLLVNLISEVTNRNISSDDGTTHVLIDAILEPPATKRESWKLVLWVGFDNGPLAMVHLERALMGIDSHRTSTRLIQTVVSAHGGEMGKAGRKLYISLPVDPMDPAVPRVHGTVSVACSSGLPAYMDGLLRRYMDAWGVTMTTCSVPNDEHTFFFTMAENVLNPDHAADLQHYSGTVVLVTKQDAARTKVPVSGAFVTETLSWPFNPSELFHTIDRKPLGRMGSVSSFGRPSSAAGAVSVRPGSSGAAPVANTLPTTDPSELLASLRIPIMIAEDNVVAMKVQRHMLSAQPMFTTIRECKDGSVAVASYKESPCPVILMDIMMPVMNGTDATACIRKFEADAGLLPALIIAVTSNASTDDEATCLRVGMDAYLYKPLRVGQLMDVIGAHYHRVAAKADSISL